MCFCVGGGGGGGSETKQRVTSVRPPQPAIMSSWDLTWFMVQETGEEREWVSRGGGQEACLNPTLIHHKSGVCAL